MTTRKDFLAASAIVAAALPEVARASSGNTVHAGPQNFDLVAFNMLLDRNFAHKHLFTARKIESGSVFEAVNATLKAYAEISVPTSAVLPVTVFYHGISPLMAFDVHVWSTYVQAMIKNGAGKSWLDDLTSAAGSSKINPFFDTIYPLTNAGNLSMFVCNNAVHGLSDLLSKWIGQPSSDVYDDLVAHLLPKASLVPAGVWAVHAIQQRGFTLLPVS